MIPGCGGLSPAAEMARRNSEKAQIQDIRERFSHYIGNVQSMRTQLRQADSSSASQRHQEEIAAIRNMYEQELGKLREKLELNYRERSGEYPNGHGGTLIAVEYQDRIWEMNRDIMKKDEEIRALQIVLAQQESGIQSLKDAAVTPTIQLELAKQDLREVQRKYEIWYEEEFSQRLKLQEEVTELTHHSEGIKQLHMKESEELRDQVVRTEAFVLQLEDKLRTVSRGGGPALMEIVQRIQDASEVEVKRLQNETETVYNHSLLELQMRLNNDQMLLGQAQEENQRLHQRVEELTNELTLLEKKLFSEETSNRTLMEKLEAEHVRGLQHIRAMEARLEEMQDLLLAKMKALNTFQESNVSLRHELDALRSMLEEEEQQMGACQMNLPQSRSSSFYLWDNSLQSSMPNLFRDYATPSEALPAAAMPEGNDLSEEGENDNHGQTQQYNRPASAPALCTHIPKHNEGERSSGSMTDSVDPKVSGTPSPTNSDLKKTPLSSALGDLEITDVDPCGNYVRIINRSPHKEEDIGGFLLQQNIRGHPVSVYRFPPKTRIMASNAVTVWASASGMPHNPPTDFLWKQQSTFVTVPRCTTILCTPNGQATAWFTPVRKKMKKSPEKYEVFESDPKILSPRPISEMSQLEERPLSGRKSQSPKSPCDRHLLEKVPKLLNREKTPPAVLPATSSPWTQSTASPTHPDFSPGQLLPSGNDGTSTCRQWRSHTAKTERPSAGAPSSGPRNDRDPSISQISKRSRGPTRSAGARKGTLRILLPGSFSSPSCQHRAGVQILQAVQDLSFQPPMPRPPALTSW